jgi:hypothetical protein
MFEIFSYPRVAKAISLVASWRTVLPALWDKEHDTVADIRMILVVKMVSLRRNQRKLTESHNSMTSKNGCIVSVSHKMSTCLPFGEMKALPWDQIIMKCILWGWEFRNLDSNLEFRSNSDWIMPTFDLHRKWLRCRATATSARLTQYILQQSLCRDLSRHLSTGIWHGKSTPVAIGGCIPFPARPTCFENAPVPDSDKRSPFYVISIDSP